MKFSIGKWAACGLLAFGTLALPSEALACGGFFCSQVQPVNQAAERIIFSKNNDGTVTAVIEIQYQGPSKNFSWLLPISTVPVGNQIAVASNVAFQRLQQATNPQYSLTTRVEGQCKTDNQVLRGTANVAVSAPGADSTKGPGVNVEAMGIVGSFEWTVISLEASLPDPADAAVNWLTANGYDVPPGAKALLGPYLADGLKLLALRLVKGADTGSIRPLVLTYDATYPMIPIKLTAVAANENMGVMAWVLGEAQAIPKNYNALELNEARINWFNASANYNDVVTAAANDAGGQGFVTEYAQPSSNLKEAIWSASEEANWQQFRQSPGLLPDEIFNNVRNQYGGMDGFWDVVKKHVTVQAGTADDFLRTCTFCGATFNTAEFLSALDAAVIQPMRVVQQLINAHPHITRFYSTLSADEMTVDPLFGFNAELPPVSNLHTAERIIECSPAYTVSDAPWRIELPKGGVLRGWPSNIGTWPTVLNDAPANQRILRQAEAGTGQVLEDNSSMILSSVNAYNETVPRASSGDGGCSAQGGARSNGGRWALVGLLGLGIWMGRRFANAGSRSAH
ncbi:MAG: DUF2330 domain-containing protein [Polyangiaceae bacterium]|nr:DUF2330 domain-containing protein [Polyangiaceae bacterium]